MSFTMRGRDEMIKKLGRLQAAAPTYFASAQYVETEVEATECKRRCPVDVTPDAPHPGNLRNAIHVEGPFQEGPFSANGGTLITTVIATGAQAPYAVFVHENLEALHLVGEAKFIEGPLLESRPYLGERIARRAQLAKMVL